MDIRLVSGSTVEQICVDDLRAALKLDDAMVWVDIPADDAEADEVLSGTFKFHPLAVRDCLERNPLPKVHVYSCPTRS